jgi:tetrahydromethanopterin S-methyltransferase subunit A
MEVSMWPVIDGRYNVGNKESPVAVCTMATVELDLPMDKIAIKGKCVTENIGIEKIVQNIVTNPNIRYLIFCGKDSRGYFIRQAIEQLIKEGVEGPNKKIRGALGAMPEVKNLTMDEVETFRKQITPVSLPDVTDPQEIMKVVEEYYSKSPGPYNGNGSAAPESRQVNQVSAEEDKEWVQDPRGFFIIHSDGGKKAISVEHHDGTGLKNRIAGKGAKEIYDTIIRLGLVSRQDHMAYLGRELHKAELAMRHGIEYVQDSELNILAACPKFVAREPKPVSQEPVPTQPEPIVPDPEPPRREAEVDDGRTPVSRTFVLAGKVTKVFTERVKEDHDFDQVRRKVGLHRAF